VTACVCVCVFFWFVKLRLQPSTANQRPVDLPTMDITKTMARGKSTGGRNSGRGGGGGGGDRSNRGGSGGGGGNDWSGGNNAQYRRQRNESNSNNNIAVGGGGEDWSRGQAPPPARQQQQSKDNRNRRGSAGQQPMLYDGPVAPLIKSENHWRPKKNASPLIVHEKKVKSILNKMTKEKFDRLSIQMIQLPILSFEMLNVMIQLILEKAIDEPLFGDMYADLCSLLSQQVKISEFIHIIESDEEPPTEGDVDPTSIESSGAVSTRNTVYRWSNDITAQDLEIIGPYDSIEECVAVAIDPANEAKPIERNDLELELAHVQIVNSVFVKVMKKKQSVDGSTAIFYTVFMPVNEAKDNGQQLSNIFLSRQECVSDANKTNAFRSSLLNKCELLFTKEDIYKEWKVEKSDYVSSKASMTESEQADKEEELEFRRIKIKKQMLGNIKFIGQLFKKALLKEKIVRFCIAHLLKLEETDEKRGRQKEYRDTGNNELDEEDHEAICSLFATVGSTIDTAQAASFMKLCFTKIYSLSQDTNLPSRTRFMYADLIELRKNSWVPRRKEEKAKTLEEIKKEFENEERRKEMQNQQMRTSMGGGVGGRNVSGDFRNSGRQSSFTTNVAPKSRKPVVVPDEEGFLTVSKNTPSQHKTQPKTHERKPAPAPMVTPSAFASLAVNHVTNNQYTRDGSSSSSAMHAPSVATLSDEVVDRRIRNMAQEFIMSGQSVEELLLSYDELSGVPGVGQKLIATFAERLMECKGDERESFMTIAVTLFERKKLSKENVQDGLADFIEFIGSSALDAPRAYEFIGQLVAKLMVVEAVDMSWLSEATRKGMDQDPDQNIPDKLIRETLSFLLKNPEGKQLARRLVTTEADKAWANLVGGDAWITITQEYLC
jgi:hypothetical protein